MTEVWRYLMKEKWVTAILCFFILGFTVAQLRTPKSNPEPNSASAFSETNRVETSRQIERVAESWSEQVRTNPKARAGVVLIGVCAVILVLWDLMLAIHWKSFCGFLRVRPVLSAEWGVGTPLKLLIYLFFVEWTLALVGRWMGLVGNGGATGVSEVSWVVFVTFVRCVILGLLMYRIAARYGRPFEQMGFIGGSLPRQVAGALGAYAGLLPVFLLSAAAVSAALSRLGYEPPAQVPLQMIYENNGPLTSALLFVFIAAAGPVFEEVLFRAFWYRALRARFGVVKGVLITGFLFAALHAHGAAFVPIAVLGIGLTVLYEVSGSVIPGCVLHAAHNGIMLGLALALKSTPLP